MKANASGLLGNIDVTLRNDPYSPVLLLNIPGKLRKSVTIHNEELEPMYERILGNNERVFFEDILFEFVAASEPPLKTKLETLQQLRTLLAKVEDVINERLLEEELEKECVPSITES